jgi:hypothetical protein
MEKDCGIEKRGTADIAALVEVDPLLYARRELFACESEKV